MKLRHLIATCCTGIALAGIAQFWGCKSETTSAQAASSNQSSARQEVSVKPKAVADPSQRRDISFDDLEFDIERDEDYDRKMLTPEIEAMHGSQVRIFGFILPSSVYRQTGIERFVLIRDNQECCFGPGAYIYHNIQVEMAEGSTADFSVRPVAVEGELHIQPWYGPDKKCYSVFHMTGTKVTK